MGEKGVQQSASVAVTSQNTDSILLVDATVAALSDFSGAKSQPLPNESEQGSHVQSNDVVFNDQSDPQSPHNWPSWRVNINVALLAALAFLIPFSASVVAPASGAILAEFKSNNDLLEAFLVSSYVLAMSFGTLIWAPLSESHGRLLVYHMTNLGFVTFSVCCALARSLTSLILFRFLSGFFGSCIMSNGGASLSDMIPTDKRAAYMAFLMMGSIVGPAVGPIAGGVLVTAAGWRWVFWLVCIVVASNAVLMLAFCKETYVPLLHRRKARRSVAQADHASLPEQSPWGSLGRGVSRPMKLLILSPLGSLLALYTALVYGFVYLLISSVAQVFNEIYSFSPTQAGLVYLGLGIGCFSGSLLVGLTSDSYTKRRSEQHDGERKPEYRNHWVPLGACCIPVGFLVFGWTAHFKIHWLVPILGIMIIGLGVNILFSSLLLYLVEAFTVFAASALAANGVVRNIGGGLLPLGGLSLFRKLGVGWGNSILALVHLLLVFPLTFILLRFGERMRKAYTLRSL